MFYKENYRARFKDVKGLLELKMEASKNPDLRKICSEIAVAASVPVVVCYEYAGEILGFTDELKKYIKEINEFYGVKSE